MACWGASSLPAASDSGAAVLATEVLHATLAELLLEQLADSAAVRTAVRSEAALAAAGAKMSAIVLDDSTELTGQEAMVRAGARIWPGESPAPFEPGEWQPTSRPPDVRLSGGTMLTPRMLGLVGALTVQVSACRLDPAGQADAEAAILAQERRALEQWAQGNPLGYLDVDAPDVTYFDDIGAHSRVEGIEAMRAYLSSLRERIPPHRYEILDPRIQLYGDMGILTLGYEATALDGKPLARWKATSVYRRAGSEWRIVHAHWSLVKGGEGSQDAGP
jgi:hypothetical protein